MKKLKITGCSDPMMWYRGLVGQEVPHLGIAVGEGFWSVDQGGYKNIVKYYDAEEVDYTPVQSRVAVCLTFDTSGTNIVETLTQALTARGVKSYTSEEFNSLDVTRIVHASMLNDPRIFMIAAAGSEASPQDTHDAIVQNIVELLAREYNEDMLESILLQMEVGNAKKH